MKRRVRSRNMARIIGTTLCALACAPAARSQAPSAGWEYEWGRGLRHEGLGLSLGGYVTAELQQLSGQPSQARLSHASLFLWWEPVDRLKVFAEIDEENALARDRSVAPQRTPQAWADRRTSLQRLHASWSFGDALSVRGGRFLTPVGLWNTQHADPLTWTASRPLLTQAVFPYTVTGLMAQGRARLGEVQWDTAVYATRGAEWVGDPLQDRFERALGGRSVLAWGGQWQLGLSLARYEQSGSAGEPRVLSGLDLRWAADGFELSAEWLRTATERAAPARPVRPGQAGGAAGSPGGGSAGSPAPGRRPVAPVSVPTTGAYVQAVAPLGGRLHAVLRLETLDDTASPQTARQTTVALVWRPTPALSLKLEQQRSRGRSDLPARGTTASLSVLF